MNSKFIDMNFNKKPGVVKKTKSKSQHSKNHLHLFLLIPLLSLIIICGQASAQSHNSLDTIEIKIRKLEAEQVESLMNGKVVEMKKNWHPNFTVNNPFNLVQDGATGPIQAGTLTYSKFERNIEKVIVHDSVVVVMGNEFIIPKTGPKGSSHDTNHPIKRRFTNIWMLKGGKWLMIARHANEICSN